MNIYSVLYITGLEETFTGTDLEVKQDDLYLITDKRTLVVALTKANVLRISCTPSETEGKADYKKGIKV